MPTCDPPVHKYAAFQGRGGSADGFQLRTLREEVILGSPGAPPPQSHASLKREDLSQLWSERWTQQGRVASEVQRYWLFKRRKGAVSPCGQPLEAGRGRKQILPWSPQRDCGLAGALAEPSGAVRTSGPRTARHHSFLGRHVCGVLLRHPEETNTVLYFPSFRLFVFPRKTILDF